MSKEELLKKNKEAYESFVQATNEIPKLLKDKDTIEKSLIKKIKELMGNNGTEREGRTEASSFLNTGKIKGILENQV